MCVCVCVCVCLCVCVLLLHNLSTVIFYSLRLTDISFSRDNSHTHPHPVPETTLEVLGPRLIQRSHAYTPSPLAGLAGTPAPTLTQQYKANQVIVRDANAIIRDVIVVMSKLR